MAGVMFGNPNILGWSCEQVAEWLRGLDDVVLPYAHFFLNNSINGKKLLTLVPEDLERLGIDKIGHQEILLEAIDLLSALHYTLESENLQSIALKVSCRSKSLYNELRDNRSNPPHPPRKRHSVGILAAVCYVLQAAKDMISWLHRPPFDTATEFQVIREKLVTLTTEIISAAQSDNRLKESEDKLMEACSNLSELCENLVRNARDPLVIQPATLEIANLRKKPTEELGIHIHSTFDGVHTISAINNQSPAQVSGKIQEGDEVIQVNYQTVVGWQHRKLVTLMRENLKEVILTLKRRPRHSSSSGNRHKRHSKKNQLSIIQSTFPKVHKRRSGTEQNGCASVPVFISALAPPDQESEREVDTDNEVFRSGSESPHSLYDAKEKHRRATVSGASPSLEHSSIDSDQTSPESEKDRDDDHKETIVGTLSITSETHVQKPYPISHHLVPDITVDKSSRRQLKFKEASSKLPVDGEPVLLGMSRIDSTKRKDESSTDEKPAEEPPPHEEGSYVIKVVGGVPQKVAVETGTTDSPVVMRSTKKPKSSRKVDRRISCKDLGQGDCEGWLEKKKSSRGIMQSKWVKRWFVLKAKILFYYRDKTDLKAEGLISLPGYKVSQAPEIKRKKYAFKLFHTGTTFFFASDRLEDMSKWMNKMMLSSIGYEMGDGVKASPFANPASIPPTIEETETPYHSESEEESDGTSDTSLTDEQLTSKSSPKHGENLMVDAAPECHSAGSSPTQSRRRQGTVVAPGVKITITQDERNPISGLAHYELQGPDAGPPSHPSPPQPTFEVVQLRHHPSGVTQTPEAGSCPDYQTPDQFCQMLDKEELTIDGKNRQLRRRTMIDKKSIRVKNPHELERVKKLKSLERTLKDKESDLSAIESLLQAEQRLTPEKLKEFKGNHPHLCDSP